MNQNRPHTGGTSSEDEENLKAVTDYIDRHIGFSFSSDQLCKIAYMGKTKLKTKFKERFGCSMRDYVLSSRMSLAQHLLLTTEKSIADIALAVGYNRPESFSKQFQKRVGLLPREYRKTNLHSKDTEGNQEKI